MAVFSIIQVATVVLLSGGVYRQSDIYIYNDRIFAKWGSGYVALHEFQGLGSTSKPKVLWESLEGVVPRKCHAKTMLFYGGDK